MHRDFSCADTAGTLLLGYHGDFQLYAQLYNDRPGTFDVFARSGGTGTLAVLTAFERTTCDASVSSPGAEGWQDALTVGLARLSGFMGWIAITPKVFDLLNSSEAAVL